MKPLGLKRLITTQWFRSSSLHKRSHILAEANMSCAETHKEVRLIRIRNYLARKWYLSRLTLILPRSLTGTVRFYTSTSNKRAARPKLYTKSLTRDLKRMYSRFTLVRISINL